MFLISCGFTGGKGKEEADGVLALADSSTLCMGVPGVTWTECSHAHLFLSTLIMDALDLKAFYVHIFPTS